MDYLLTAQLMLTISGITFGALMLLLATHHAQHEKTHYLIMGFGSIIVTCIVALA